LHQFSKRLYALCSGIEPKFAYLPWWYVGVTEDMDIQLKSNKIVL